MSGPGNLPDSVFDSVYSLCFRKVYAYFSAAFGPLLAEDLSQQVFVKLWRYLSKEDAVEPDNWQAWIFRLAINEKNDYLRKKQRTASTSEYNDALENMQLDRRDADEESIAVRQAFACLAQEERELLTLKSIGFTSAEIGALWGISDSTIRSRLSAAKKRFRENLMENGVNCDG